MDTFEIIQSLCKERGITVNYLENLLGFGNSSLRKKGANYLRSDRLLAVAQYFNVPMEYLMTGEMPSEQDYYVDKDVADLAEEFRVRPEMKIMFDASKDVSRRDLLMVAELLERLKGTQYGEEED